MIRFVLSLVLVFVVFNSSAQTIYFNTLYGDDSTAEAGFSITSLDSNYFITGGSNPAHSLSPSADITICLNQKGDILWKQEDTLYDLTGFNIELFNNNIYEVGNADFYYTVPNRQAIFFKKLKPNGDSVWTRYYQFRLLDFGTYLIPTFDSGFVIVGSMNKDTNIYDYNFKNTNICIIKTDSNGNVLWVDSLLANPNGCYANSGMENKDHSITITGYYGLDSALALKLDNNGHLLWYKTYQSGFYDETGSCIIGTADNGYLIAGNQAEGLVGYEIYYNWVMKIDSLGNMQWQKTYGDSLYTNGFRQIRQTLDGNYILIGSSQDYNEDTIYANLYKIDSAGNTLFERKFYRIPYPEGVWNGFTYDILSTPDSGFIFVGSNFDTTSRVWVVKTDKYGCDSMGCQLATSVAHIEPYNSSFNIYPNPALSQTTVLYSVSENAQQVNLFVYDIAGRMVEQQPLDKDSHQAILDVGDLSAGMYLIELKTDSGVVVKKLVVE